MFVKPAACSGLRSQHPRTLSVHHQGSRGQMLLRGPGAGLEGMWPCPPGESQKRVVMARLGSVLQGLDHDSCDNEVGKGVKGRETFQNAPVHPMGQSFPRMVVAALSVKTVLAPNFVSASMFLLLLTSALTHPPGGEDSAGPA